MKRPAFAFLSPLLMAAVMGSLAQAAQVSPAAPGPVPPPLTSVTTASPTENLFIYRAHAESAWSPTISIDGTKIVALPKRHYTSTSVAPGVHTLSVSWSALSGQGGTDMRLEIKGSELHYFEITDVSHVAGFGYHKVYLRMGSGVAEVVPEEAQKAIAVCCKYKAPTQH